MKVLDLGATGLCGRGFLKAAEDSAAFSEIFTLTRRELKEKPGPKVESIVEPDTSKWVSLLPSVDTVFSALGTTRAAAGSFANQVKIDHDLNIELAKAAKARGVRTYVLVSSIMASDSSWLPYLRMKGEIERDIKAVGFEKTIILRPGTLVGERDRMGDTRGAFADIFESVAKYVHRTPLQALMWYPVYGDEVGAVACELSTSLQNGFHIIEKTQILDLARKSAGVD